MSLLALGHWHNLPVQRCDTHNDPAVLIADRRAKDAARKKSPRPIGIPTESDRSPEVEKRREEKRREAAPSDSGRGTDCPHDSSSDLCLICTRPQRAAS